MVTSALRLATRGSRLARTQTELVASALAAAGGPPAELVVLTTRGDREAGAPPGRMEGQGWFTTELELALLDGRADAAVHSAKDLPTRLSPGLEIVALTARDDPRDGVITRDGRRLADLPPGATVGTGSPRRRTLIGAHHPALLVVPLRGNVDTRLRRLDAGELDAVVLACAGMDRLGWGGRIGERLDPRVFVPAPAQGALAVEAVSGAGAEGPWSPLHDAATAAAVTAERALLTALGGGCLLPLGAWARMEGSTLVLSAALGTADGVRTAELGGPIGEAARLGGAVAARLR